MTSGVSFNKVTKWLTVTLEVPISRARSLSFRATPESISRLYSFAKCIGLRYLRRCGGLDFGFISSVTVNEKVLRSIQPGEPFRLKARTSRLRGFSLSVFRGIVYSTTAWGYSMTICLINERINDLRVQRQRALDTEGVKVVCSFD